jgi:hypothetical protein
MCPSPEQARFINQCIRMRRPYEIPGFQDFWQVLSTGCIHAEKSGYLGRCCAFLAHGVNLGIGGARSKQEHLLSFLEGPMGSFIPRMLPMWSIDSRSPKLVLTMPHCAWLMIPLLEISWRHRNDWSFPVGMMMCYKIVLLRWPLQPSPLRYTFLWVWTLPS